jgi:polyisoprenoid-binding protein YceI
MRNSTNFRLIVFGLAFAVVGSAGLLTAGSQTTQRFILDPSQGKFIAHAHRGGLLWFKGHDHYLAARKFSGEVEMTPEQITPASLHLVVQADSLEETSSAFTDQQKQIINKEVKDIVLQPAQYPEIVFQSSSVNAKLISAGQYELEIQGDLSLHGIKKRMKIPSKLTLSGNDLRATGEFSVDRDDYKVKATSAAHGLVRVKHNVTFEFDIVGHR